MERSKGLKSVLILVFLSYLFFMLGNGILSLTNPDEVFYAQTAKEMIQHNTWMTPYLFGQPQFEKPVLTYWFLRIGFILFGFSSFAARFFPAIFAMIGVISVYFLGLLSFKDEKKAFLSSLILMSAGFYVGLGRTVFTDMIFSVFILLSLLSFFWGYSLQDKKAAGLSFFFIFSGLAVLTKGPLGLLIPLLTVVLFLLIKKDIKFLLSKYSVLGLFIFTLISLPWYIFMMHRYGQGFIHEFFYNDHIRRLIQAEHAGNDRWYFYPLSMIGCMFPWSLFVIVSLISLPARLRQRVNPFYYFLGCWIVAVFLIFQFAHSKLGSYILPLFPALSLITADFIYDALSENNRSRIVFLISVTTSSIFFLIPVGMGIALLKYPLYIHSKIPFFCLAAGFLALGVLMLNFILKQELLKGIHALTLAIPVFLCIVPLMHNDIEPYVSSKEACEYMLKNYTVNNTILSSKAFIRGIRYYTDKDVAVTSIPGIPFFSPHPIAFLDRDEKVRDFLGKQSLTYCILNKSSVEDIQRITSGRDFKYTILKVIGNGYLLKIETRPAIPK